MLIDSEGLQYRAYMEALAPFGVEVTPETYAREWIAAGRGPEWAVATYELPLTPAELRARKDPLYRRLSAEHAAPMPGAADALVRLAERHRLAVATNSGREDTLFLLERFGLLEHFHAVVTRECYAKPKPEPDAFQTAASECGAAPERCVVVEDSERGLRAALAAGIRAVVVPNEWTRASDLSRASLRIATLAELTHEAIAALLGQPDTSA